MVDEKLAPSGRDGAKGAMWVLVVYRYAREGEGTVDKRLNREKPPPPLFLRHYSSTSSECTAPRHAETARRNAVRYNGSELS
ncbi:hypothetical protein ALC60_04225 [Trachymyrmex zeteki]|uniref:Uncharacterized protein n=1 Tax=Mycetomoellerius zeteki TaxID=64791 RepID=A0A151X915_9HYME|nr:hypothetical protein ALC60_04225 [Trachymyrmex zeteki]